MPRQLPNGSTPQTVTNKMNREVVVKMIMRETSVKRKPNCKDRATPRLSIQVPTSKP